MNLRLGHNPGLYLPRLRHNQNGERINSDEDYELLEDVAACHAGWALQSFPFVIIECPISFIHQKEDRLCSPNLRKPARYR